MKILVINGDCIETNSSANLCHLAYIRGLLDAGNKVTLLSANGKDYRVDPSLKVPQEVIQYSYDGISLYQRLSMRKKSGGAAPLSGVGSSTTGHNSVRQQLISTAKRAVLALYGVHDIAETFIRRAKKFRSDELYDYVLSISTPPSSHRIAYNLLHSQHIRAKHWIQIWEDPWYSDVYGCSAKSKKFEEEKQLLSFAEKVCYVSPLTLRNQQRLFPESADKMFWMPLPAYYRENPARKALDHNIYGYFGDYNPVARDLAPFYQAAKMTGIEVNICGNPSNLFQPDGQIHIYPRLSLTDLQPIEEKTSILVFLCNRKGGQIPGKIYQYSATEKTVLFILDGTEEEQGVLREYFGQFNRYVFCRNTPEDIARTIVKIESDDLEGVQNRPLDDFEPVKIIAGILEAGK